MLSDLALLSTLIGSNYPCLELIFMVPKVFEPLKFDCICQCEQECLSKLFRLQTADPSQRFIAYRKNSKNWDTLNYYRDCPTNGIVGFYSAILRSKGADRITNRVDTDQTAP